MESNRKYSAGLMSQSFWFVEFRHYLRFKKENISDDEIKRRITEENLFGAPNDYRAHRIGNYLSARAGRMSQEELMLFFACDIKSQKLINLICIMRNDRLLFEFINEVYREKVMLGAETIDLSDGRVFFTEKEKQDDTVGQDQAQTHIHISEFHDRCRIDVDVREGTRKKQVRTEADNDTDSG